MYTLQKARSWRGLYPFRSLPGTMVDRMGMTTRNPAYERKGGGVGGQEVGLGHTDSTSLWPLPSFLPSKTPGPPVDPTRTITTTTTTTHPRLPHRHSRIQIAEGTPLLQRPPHPRLPRSALPQHRLRPVRSPLASAASPVSAVAVRRRRRVAAAPAARAGRACGLGAR